MVIFDFFLKQCHLAYRNQKFYLVFASLSKSLTTVPHLISIKYFFIQCFDLHEVRYVPMFLSWSLEFLNLIRLCVPHGLRINFRNINFLSVKNLKKVKRWRMSANSLIQFYLHLHPTWTRPIWQDVQHYYIKN